MSEMTENESVAEQVKETKPTEGQGKTKTTGEAVMDADGNVLLDFSSGIAVQNAGWTHYKVSKAIQEQAAKLIHSMANDAYFDKEAYFAKLLSEISPGKALKGTFFGNSGAEAVEAALT